ncbi:RNA polymerase sigma factor [uncultured Ruminococcus sp.]|uniref:RNA polymerase sigma factor n=1 Tax=uncultured Ruminococcus sp. TaxID=165186 RepID=UPI001564ED3F|nr:sigma-70 family RNA polymerase sigma factor [uncultured Ruminococcus sp.]
MSRRRTYSDTFTGKADEGIRLILEGKTDEDSRSRLRNILLKVIKNELTPRQKEIIMLYYFQNKDIVTIGRELGVTPQAVSAAMSRARLRMFRILQYYI